LSYPSDLKDNEWALIEPYFQPEDRRGSGCKHPRKRIVEAILYIVKTGAQWRQLPNDFPPWKTVYDHFSRWNKKGVWEKALDELNRKRRKKTAEPLGPVTASSTRKASRPSTTAKNAASTAAKK
jgi:putative transposase